MTVEYTAADAHAAPQQHLGFDVPGYDDNEASYEMLTIAWIELVRERLAVPA